MVACVCLSRTHTFSLGSAAKGNVPAAVGDSGRARFLQHGLQECAPRVPVRQGPTEVGAGITGQDSIMIDSGGGLGGRTARV